MTTQTMVGEKILSAKTGRDVLPNDRIVVPVDLAFAQRWHASACDPVEGGRTCDTNRSRF